MKKIFTIITLLTLLITPAYGADDTDWFESPWYDEYCGDFQYDSYEIVNLFDYGLLMYHGILYAPLYAPTDLYNYTDTVYDNVEAESAKDDLYWLSRIINAEAEGEPFEGKLAVGSVIMNRVESNEFPDSIYDVIFDSEYGVQFTATVNGRIYDKPTEESVNAARMCLDGIRLDVEMLYFLNEGITESPWISQNCRFVMSIGNHSFYS